MLLRGVSAVGFSDCVWLLLGCSADCVTLGVEKYHILCYLQQR